jgi:hypothetical protein
VHSLTDVPVFAMGPCQELFGGGKYPFARSHFSANEALVYNSIDIFYSMSACFGLARGAPS